MVKKMKYVDESLAADIIQLAVLGYVSFSHDNGILRIVPTEKSVGPGAVKGLRELSLIVYQMLPNINVLGLLVPSVAFFSVVAPLFRARDAGMINGLVLVVFYAGVSGAYVLFSRTFVLIGAFDGCCCSA